MEASIETSMDTPTGKPSDKHIEIQMYISTVDIQIMDILTMDILRGKPFSRKVAWSVMEVQTWAVEGITDLHD